MKNRELTYYSLSPRQDLRNKFYTADRMDSQGFINLGFDEKWRHHLLIVHNNKYFLRHLKRQVDLESINQILTLQLDQYTLNFCEEFKGEDEYSNLVYQAKTKWLTHTIWICKKKYIKTENEIFNEAVKWCEKWLETLVPKTTNKKSSQFSVLEWATIFYYADEAKLLPTNNTKKKRIEKFLKTHSIETTFDNLKSKYYEVKKRINVKNDFPIKKLEKITPFLKKNYNQTISKVKNDIIFLEGENPDY